MYRQGVLFNTVMIGSLALVVGGALQRFVNVLRPGYLLAAVVLIALEAAIVHYAYRRNRMWTSELLRYLAPELLIMLVLMRIATSLGLSASLAEDARGWMLDPLSVFDPPFLLAVFVGLVVGFSTHATMQALRELQPHEFEQPSQEDDSARIRSLAAHDRALALRSISTRFVVGGVFVLCALALETVNISRIFESGRTISRESALGALLYLVSGFLLYSHARLALLSARWRIDGAEVSPLVARRWTRSSWLIIAGVALVAVALPRTYAMGLLDTFRALLGVVSYAFALLGYAVIWLFGLIALIPALLLSLIRIDGSSAPPPPLESLPPPPLPPPSSGPSLGPALVFWLCMLLLVGYAFQTIIQRHPLLVEKLVGRGPLRRLFAWLQSLWFDTRGWASQAIATVRERLSQPTDLNTPVTRRFIRLGALAPRDLVRYFYRSTLHRAAERGVPRHAGQTPNEYRADLARAVPDAEPDIAALTESFLAAQYSPRDIRREDAQRARRPWQRLRARLRSTTQSSEE